MIDFTSSSTWNVLISCAAFAGAGGLIGYSCRKLEMESLIDHVTQLTKINAQLTTENEELNIINHQLINENADLSDRIIPLIQSAITAAKPAEVKKRPKRKGGRHDP